jgi:DNA-binding XRE family transcriptional regulator
MQNVANKQDGLHKRRTLNGAHAVRLARERRERGYSKAEVARWAGVTPQTVARLEKGLPVTDGTLIAVAVALGAVKFMLDDNAVVAPEFPPLHPDRGRTARYSVDSRGDCSLLEEWA